MPAIQVVTQNPPPQNINITQPEIGMTMEGTTVKQDGTTVNTPVGVSSTTGVSTDVAGNTVDAFVHEKYLSSLRTNRKGHAKILKRSNIGRRLARMAKSKNDIQLHLNNH